MSQVALLFGSKWPLEEVTQNVLEFQWPMDIGNYTSISCLFDFAENTSVTLKKSLLDPLLQGVQMENH